MANSIHDATHNDVEWISMNSLLELVERIRENQHRPLDFDDLSDLPVS